MLDCACFMVGYGILMEARQNSTSCPYQSHKILFDPTDTHFGSLMHLSFNFPWVPSGTPPGNPREPRGSGTLLVFPFSRQGRGVV